MRLMFLLLFSAFALTGCSLPRVIVLHDPLDARQHNDLGVAYQQRGESDLAIREYDRAAELEKRWALPLINRGNVHAGNGQWREAEKSYKLALRREPTNAEAMNNLAWVLLQEKEPEEALVWAEKAVATQPREPAFLDTLAEIYIALRQYDEAREAVSRALALDSPPELREGLEQKLARIDSLGKR